MNYPDVYDCVNYKEMYDNSEARYRSLADEYNKLNDKCIDLKMKLDSTLSENRALKNEIERYRTIVNTVELIFGGKIDVR